MQEDQSQNLSFSHPQSIVFLSSIIPFHGSKKRKVPITKYLKKKTTFDYTLNTKKKSEVVFFIKESQEVIQIALEKQTANKRLASSKVAARIKFETQDIFVYNGVSQYLVQTFLKEVTPHVS